MSFAQLPERYREASLVVVEDLSLRFFFAEDKEDLMVFSSRRDLAEFLREWSSRCKVAESVGPSL